TRVRLAGAAHRFVCWPAHFRRRSKSWPGSSRFNRCGRHSSSRTRTIEKCFLGLLERRDRLFLGDGREVFQEFGERLSTLEIVDQRLERHTGADEHGSPAHDFGIAMDDRLLVHDEAIVAAERASLASML